MADQMLPPNLRHGPEGDARLQTQQVTVDLIAYIVEKIARRIAPQRIILFGSYARGDATSASDLDLFIVQDSQASNREVRREIERLLWGRRFGVDLIVRRPEEVARNLADANPFYVHHLMREGRVLYERTPSTREARGHD
jgi:predicted nucleotidyltransferase